MFGRDHLTGGDMLSKVRSLLLKVLVLPVSSILIFAVLTELALRSFSLASDVPDTTFDPLLGNHFKPNQTGVYKKGIGPQIQAKYRINSAGWNSPREYSRIKAIGTYRIAVIGDSYVEALQVDYDKSFVYIMERALNAKAPGFRTEAFSFGHSGANLAQYLNVFRYVTKLYDPDLVVITIVYNDFRESLYQYARKDNYSLRLSGGRVIEACPRRTDRWILRSMGRLSATVRFLVINLNILERFRYFRNLINSDVRKYQANIEISEKNFVGDGDLLTQVLGYILGELRMAASKTGTEILLVVDGNRQTIYAGSDPRGSKTFVYNSEIAEVARALDISSLDLTDTFLVSWEEDGQRFDWTIDGHWNEHGHRTVAKAVTDWITSASASFRSQAVASP